MIPNIEKYPVLIISCPRTGSTSLAKTLANSKNIPFFSEPLVCKAKDIRHIRYIEWRKSENQNFILKVQACQWRDFIKADSNIELEKFYRIGLRRKNIIDQMASLYVSLHRDVWAYKPNINYDEFYNEEIEITEEKILKCIQTILATNRDFETFESDFNITFDVNLYYEDLNLEGFIKTPLPKNYNDLKKEIMNSL
jgi:LPS sulfotransferase NodH